MTCNEDVVEANLDDNSGCGRVAWGAKEDDALVSAWLQCSIDDPEKATDQDLARMWRDIKALYDASRAENPAAIRQRTMKSLKSRWTRINAQVNIWVGAYAEAKRRKRSGDSEADVISTAHNLFRQSANGNRFSMLTIWEELKDNDKWKTNNKKIGPKSGGSSKRSEPDTPTDEEGASSRPDGVKKAKRKAKGSSSTSMKSLETFTQALSEMNMRKAESTSTDRSRVDAMNQMLGYQRERDAQKMQHKLQKREEEKRFRIFTILISKPNLDEEEQSMLAELKKEFMHL